MNALNVVFFVLLVVQQTLVLRVSAEDEVHVHAPNDIAYEDEDTLEYREDYKDDVEPMSGSDDDVAAGRDVEMDMDEPTRMKRQISMNGRYPSSVGVAIEMKNYMDFMCGAASGEPPAHSAGKSDLQLAMVHVQKLSTQLARAVNTYSNSFTGAPKVPPKVDKFFLGSGKWSLHGSLNHLSCLFARTLPIFLQMYALQLPDFTHNRCDHFPKIVAKAKYSKASDGCIRPSIIWNGRQAYKKDIKCLADAFKHYQLVTDSANALLSNSTSGRFSYRQVARLLTNNVVTFSDIAFDARNIYESALEMKSLYVSNAGTGKSVICSGYRLAHEQIAKKKKY